MKVDTGQHSCWMFSSASVRVCMNKCAAGEGGGGGGVYLGCSTPVAGFGGDGEGGDHAALACAVADVQLDAQELRAGLAVAGVDAEGEDRNEHAH